jgi:hypothetical protein
MLIFVSANGMMFLKLKRCEQENLHNNIIAESFKGCPKIIDQNLLWAFAITVYFNFIFPKGTNYEKLL